MDEGKGLLFEVCIAILGPENLDGVFDLWTE
jgi:hypothetical protein